LEAPTLDQSLGEQQLAQTRSQQPEALHIPGYLLSQLLGSGTFGQVWAGTSKRTGLEVAVKVFTQTVGMDWDYLRQEVDRLGKVAEHPHVVTLLDADLNHSPPYFCMRRYQGSLHQWRHDHPSGDPDQVVRWWKQTAQALLYTHSKGLLHCDLKPSNLLLDEEGRALLSDFGQAAGVRGGRGSHLGSLGYMAPEQASQLEEGSASPDVLWDIYALGASFYYLLSKHLPRLSDAALHELGSVSQTAEKLSRYRRTLQEQKLVPIRQYCPNLNSDLAHLLEACLQLDPRQRPQSAAEILEDFERSLQGRPLLCRRPWTAPYRAKRFISRNLAALVVGGLGLGMVAFWTAQNYQEQRRMQARSDFDKGMTLLHEGRTLAAAHYWARSLSIRPGQMAPRWFLREDPAHLQFYQNMRDSLNAVGFSPDGNLLYASAANGTQVYDLRTSQRRGLRLGQGQQPQTDLQGMAYQNFPPAGVALGPDCLLVLAGQTEIWQLASAQKLGLSLPPAYSAQCSQDGRRILLVTPQGPKLFEVNLSGPSATALKLEGMPPQPGCLALSRDGQNWAASDNRGEVWLNGKPIFALQHPLNALGFSPDGRWLVASAEKQHFALWDLKDQHLHSPPDEHYRVYGLAFSENSRYMALSCYDGITYLYDLLEFKDDSLNHAKPARRLSHKWLTYNSSFSPDSRYLATFSVDGTARVYECESGRAVSPYLEHSSPVKSVAFRPGPSLDKALDLATACEDGSIRVFRLDLYAQPLSLQTRPNQNIRGGQAKYSPDGQTLAVAVENLDQDQGWIEFWQQGRLSRTVTLPGNPRLLEWASDGHLAVAVAQAAPLDSSQGAQAKTDTLGLLAVLAGHPGEAENRQLKFSSPITALTTSASGQMAIGCQNGQIHLYQQNRLQHTFQQRGPGEVYSVHFSPDGSHLLCSNDSQAELWDITSRALVGTAPHQGPVREAVFSPDAKRIATASSDKTAQIWEIQSDGLKPLLAHSLHHELAVNDVQFSPDGQLLATASADCTAGLWNPDTGRPATPRLRHAEPVWRIRFSPDGQLISTCTKKGNSLIWCRDGMQVASPIEHKDWVYSSSFSPDSRQLGTVSYDGTLQFRDLNPPQSAPIEQLRRQVEQRTGMHLEVEMGSCLLKPLSPEEWARIGH